MRWPDFFVVGAARAGSTSLHHYLSGHPEISLPAIKESHFFAPNVAHNDKLVFRPIRSEEDYRALFNGIGSPVGMTVGLLNKAGAFKWQLRTAWRRRSLDPVPPRWAQWLKGALAGEYLFPLMGEVCPSYLWDGDSASRIQAANPAAKIIAVLRNPVERAYSHYRLDVQTGIQSLPFEQALRNDRRHEPRGWGRSNLYLDLGLYGMQLKRYFDRFSEDQIKVILFEHLERDTESVVRDLLRFLGVTEPDLPLDLGRRLARSTGKQPAEITAEAEELLIEYYRDDLLLLQSLIGVELPG